MGQRSLIDRVRRRLLRSLIARESRHGQHYMTTHARPKTAAAIGLSAAASPKYSLLPVLRSDPCAIVMQGPVMPDDAFTIETLKLYAAHMPDCRLILSTWIDTPAADLAPLRELGVDILLNDKPEHPGLVNINMQIASAAAGVRKAAAEGAEWILKTRTDQRLNDPDVMSGLIAMARSLPPTGSAVGRQRHRIIGVGHGTLIFAPYHLCDQTVFGHAEDMLVYWTPPLRTEPAPAHWPDSRERQYLDVPIGEASRYGAAESYFCSRFLEHLGRELHWTIADSWAAYRDHFATVDYGSTDFYWIKAQLYTYRDGVRSYNRLTNRRELTFLDWMLLHAGHLTPEDAAPYESILDECFTPFNAGYP